MNAKYTVSGIGVDIMPDGEAIHELLETGESSVGKLILKTRSKMSKELNRVLIIL